MMTGVLERLSANWVYGGFMAGFVLLLLTPVFTAGWPQAEMLVYLVLPVYMLHQFEEHDRDRFRQFVNAHIGHGREVLTPGFVFAVNIFGVWWVAALAMLAMRFIDAGWGMVAVYLVLVNAVLHIVQMIAMRQPNPGVWTAIVLFLPLGAAGFAGLWSDASLTQHVVSLVLILALHGLILARVKAGLAANTQEKSA